MKSGEKVNLLGRVDIETRKRLRMRLIEDGMTYQEWLDRKIEQYLKGSGSDE
jgi:hypothetical protein